MSSEKSYSPATSYIENIPLSKYYTKDRVAYAKIVKKFLKDIELCFNKKTPNMLINKDGAKILFDNEIGSRENGTIYKHKVVDGKNNSDLVFSSKIDTSGFNFTYLANIYKKMTNLVINDTTQHMPIIYKVGELCDDNSTSISFSELADGDVKQLFKSEHSAEVYESIFMQMFIALHTFHKYCNKTHGNSHIEKFLYHKVQKGGYWHYIIGDTNIYVPNKGYLIVLWDPFAVSSNTIVAKKLLRNYDYIFLIKSIVEDEEIKTPPDSIINSFKDIELYTGKVFTLKTVKAMMMKNTSEFLFADYFNKNTKLDFKHIIITKKQLSSKSSKIQIINTTPYIL